MPSPILLTGPTAVGKSAVALLLAERLHGEIISVDSMQVYAGLDIGTDKPTAEERRRVRHHLIDIAALDETFDAAKFVNRATAAVRDIEQRGHQAIFCGGTGLYFRAYLDGLGAAPAADPVLRGQLEKLPLPELLRELAEKDPVTHARIDQRNPRRVVRALEVIRLTGRPFSDQRSDWNAGNAGSLPPCIALQRQPEDLQSRIDQRVDRMFARGLVEETRQLLPRGLAGNRTAMQAIGYRQVAGHLQGERSLEETVALVKRKTWQFARRQMTWLRHQLPVTWISLAPEMTTEDVVRRVEESLGELG